MLNILTIYDYENTYYGYRVLVTGGEYICDIYLVYTCTDNGIGQGYIDIYSITFRQYWDARLILFIVDTGFAC